MGESQEPATPEMVAGMVLRGEPRDRPFHPTEFMFEHNIEYDLMRDAIEVLRKTGHLTEKQVPGWPEESHVTEMFLTDKRSAGRAGRGPYPELYSIFRGAAGEHFEDGLNSHFSLELKRIIRERGDAAVHAARAIMAERRANHAVVAEAMIWMGHMRDSVTHQSRRRALEWGLESPSTIVRDGAATGIEAMDDPESIPRLKRAARVEKVDWLRLYMKDVLKQLRWVAPRRHIPQDGCAGS